MSLRHELAEAWEYALPTGDYWYLHPAAGYPLWFRKLVPLLRPLGSIAFRFKLAYVLLRTPRNNATYAPWDAPHLRWKALALLPLPLNFRARLHAWGGHRTDADSVVVFDPAGDSYSWTYWVLECPTGWRIAGLSIYRDGDCISV